MNALDHFREGRRLLALAQRTPVEALRDESIPFTALLVDQARAHFDAARTMLAALSALDMPAHDYEAWERLALAEPVADVEAFEDVDDEATGGGR